MRREQFINDLSPKVIVKNNKSFLLSVINDHINNQIKMAKILDIDNKTQKILLKKLKDITKLKCQQLKAEKTDELRVDISKALIKDGGFKPMLVIVDEEVQGRMVKDKIFKLGQHNYYLGFHDVIWKNLLDYEKIAILLLMEKAMSRENNRPEAKLKVQSFDDNLKKDDCLFKKDNSPTYLLSASLITDESISPCLLAASMLYLNRQAVFANMKADKISNNTFAEYMNEELSTLRIKMETDSLGGLGVQDTRWRKDEKIINNTIEEFEKQASYRFEKKVKEHGLEA